jgi:hypothetical protein
MRILTSFLIVLITLVAATSCKGSESDTISLQRVKGYYGTKATNSFIFTAAGDYGSSKDTTGTLDLISRSDASRNLALGDLSYTDAPKSG